MSISTAFIRRPVATILLTFGIAASGAVAFSVGTLSTETVASWAGSAAAGVSGGAAMCRTAGSGRTAM